MKALIPLLFVSTSVLAVTTFQYAHRASAESRRAEEALANGQKAEARIHELETERGALDRQLMEAQRPAMAVTSPTLQRGTPRSFTLNQIARAEPASVAHAVTPFQWYPGSQQSPAAQRYWQWHRKASLRREYEGVGSALGLSREQENKLIEVLGNQQMPFSTASLKQPPDRATALQAVADMRTRTDAEVAAVIGADKLPQWQEYQKTMPERTRVNNVGEQLRQMDVPLTDDQRSRLVDIMIEHTEQNPRPTPQDGLPPEEMWKAAMKWEEDADKALLERAKSVLTSDQYDRYRDYQAWESEMRANALSRIQGNLVSGQFSNEGVVQLRSLVTPAVPAEPPK